MNSAEWLIKQAKQLPDASLASLVNALTLELLDRALRDRTPGAIDTGKDNESQSFHVG